VARLRRAGGWGGLGAVRAGPAFWGVGGRWLGGSGELGGEQRVVGEMGGG